MHEMNFVHWKVMFSDIQIKMQFALKFIPYQ